MARIYNITALNRHYTHKEVKGLLLKLIQSVSEDRLPQAHRDLINLNHKLNELEKGILENGDKTIYSKKSSRN